MFVRVQLVLNIFFLLDLNLFELFKKSKHDIWFFHASGYLTDLIGCFFSSA